MIARATRLTIAGAIVAVLAVAAPGNAITRPTIARGGCGSFPDLVSAAHAQAVRREQTLSTLVTILQARQDPFHLNSGQISTLQGARSTVTTLDTNVQTGCYTTRTALVADIVPLFEGQRVYWLRVPQTQVTVAADYLGEAQSRLADAAARLGAAAGSNATVRADVTAMRTALATATGALGAAPAASSTITAVAALQPARDMTADVAAIEAARAHLTAARAALVTARAAGLRAVAQLHD